MTNETILGPSENNPPNQEVLREELTMLIKKPTHAKPQLYAYYFLVLKELAHSFGYNLIVHGSMARDLDLIAIPWVDDPKPELDLINALSECMTGRTFQDKQHYMFNELPGGRHSYVINLNRGGYARNERGEISDPIEFTPDPEYYIDISVTPLK